MGEAKARGTPEQRAAEAIEKKEQEPPHACIELRAGKDGLDFHVTTVNDSTNPAVQVARWMQRNLEVLVRMAENAAVHERAQVSLALAAARKKEEDGGLELESGTKRLVGPDGQPMQ